MLTDRIAHGLAARGVGEGDAVGIFLPMIPETVAAVMAVAKLGAIFLPIFSGYGADAVAVRLEDGDAKAARHRRRRRCAGASSLPMKETADAAVAGVPSVETVVVVPARRARRRADDRRAATSRSPSSPRSGPDEPFAALQVDSEHPLFVAYTSGTTGRPKGAVHVHGGFLVKIAEEVGFQTDVRPDDVLFWLTDLGWIMGPWQIVGTLAWGATMFCFDGAPDFPGPDRLWSMVERHRITILGVSPDARARAHGEGRRARRRARPVVAARARVDRRAVERGTVALVLRARRRRPLPDRSTSAAAPRSVPASSRRTSSSRSRRARSADPALGCAVDVVDDDCNPVRGVVGELVCRKPWPAMTRGLWNDPERYLDTYWSRWPGVWWHGDWASIDESGQWFLHGRSDDTIKVAGKRLGPAEVENVLVEHPAVVEAAAVGLPDELKGESLACYVVVGAGVEPSEELRGELRAHVADRLGKSFTPGHDPVHDRAPEDPQQQGDATHDPGGRARPEGRRPVGARGPGHARCDHGRLMSGAE